MAISPLGTKNRNFEVVPYVWLAAILAIVAVLRIRFLNIPLERDEGGFAYMGRLILQGIPPYTQAYDFKPPGLYLLYAIFESVFGDNARGIHTGLLAVNLATIVALFFLARKWMSAAAALGAATVYGILSLSSSVLGFAAHASHFVTFWAVCGALFLAWWSDRGGKALLILSGFSLALSLLMSQPGAVFIAYGALVVLIRRREGGLSLGTIFRDECWFFTGTAVPILAAIGWLLIAGAFRQFFFWNITYGFEFGNRIALQDALPRFLEALPSAMHAFWIIWVLGGIGMIMYLTSEEGPEAQLQFVLFALGSLAALSLGFQYRRHSFVMFLPVVAMLAGYFISGLRVILRDRNARSRLNAIPLLLLVVTLGFGMVVDRDYFFNDEPEVIVRKTYFPNPFADAGRIGDYLRSETTADDRIAVLGSEPEILYRSGRRSATPYLFMYFFMEPHAKSLDMEKEMAAGIEHAAPKYIVYVKQPFSWGTRSGSEMYIYDWAGEYLKQGYDLEGIADLSSPLGTDYRWGAGALSKPPGPNGAVLIFRRR